MPVEPGKEKTGGRVAGVPNKLTKTVKETVLEVFNKLQESKEHNIEAFAQKYPRDFYNIAAKLIPTEIQAKVANVGNKYLFEQDAESDPIPD